MYKYICITYYYFHVILHIYHQISPGVSLANYHRFDHNTRLAWYSMHSRLDIQGLQLNRSRRIMQTRQGQSRSTSLFCFHMNHQEPVTRKKEQKSEIRNLSASSLSLTSTTQICSRKKLFDPSVVRTLVLKMLFMLLSQLNSSPPMMNWQKPFMMQSPINCPLNSKATSQRLQNFSRILMQMSIPLVVKVCLGFQEG